MTRRAHRSVKTLALAAICAVALPAAGCGGSSNASYKTKVQAASNQLQKDVQGSQGQLTSPSSPADFAAGSQKYRAAISKFNNTLAGLKPPSGAQTAQNNVIRDLNKLSADVGSASSALSSNNASQLQQLQQTTQTDRQQLDTDLQALKGAVK